jgi:CheY-like chemotaxis protein
MHAQDISWVLTFLDTLARKDRVDFLRNYYFDPFCGILRTRFPMLRMDPSIWPNAADANDSMKIAILEPDLDELDRALETLSTSGHLCFGATCDDGLRRLLEEVSVDLFLIDWSNPDSGRYETLLRLTQYESATPVVLCVSAQTAYCVVESGLKRGASFSIEKPLRSTASLDVLPVPAANGISPGFAIGHRIM